MKRKTIIKHEDFMTPPDTITGRSEFFFIKTRLAKYPKDPRYGLVASKRMFKLAVDRNRAKRLLRDWIEFNQDLMLPALDYIFLATPKIFAAQRDAARELMRKSLRRIAIIYRLHGNRKWE